MEVFTSRALLRPRSFERTFRFYAERLGLHVYREWGADAPAASSSSWAGVPRGLGTG